MTSFDRVVGRLLIGVTYFATALLVIGVLLMLVGGISPLSVGPRLDPSALVVDLATLSPAGFLWVGLLAVIATPISRVIAAAIGFAREGDSRMVGVSIAILVVIVASVVAATAPF